MKKYLIIIVVLILTSCVGSKKVTDRNSRTTQKETSEVKKDSSNIIEKNKAIDNEYTIPLKTADSLTNARIREALRNFKASARSGNNSTKIVFDEEALAFKIAALVGATQNQTVETNSDTKTEKTFEQQTDEYVSKKVKAIPWWFWVGLIIWFLPQIISRLKLIINPISGLLQLQKDKPV